MITHTLNIPKLFHILSLRSFFFVFSALIFSDILSPPPPPPPPRPSLFLFLSVSVSHSLLPPLQYSKIVQHHVASIVFFFVFSAEIFSDPPPPPPPTHTHLCLSISFSLLSSLQHSKIVQHPIALFASFRFFFLLLLLLFLA